MDVFDERSEGLGGATVFKGCAVGGGSFVEDLSVAFEDISGDGFSVLLFFFFLGSLPDDEGEDDDDEFNEDAAGGFAMANSAPFDSFSSSASLSVAHEELDEELDLMGFKVAFCRGVGDFISISESLSSSPLMLLSLLLPLLLVSSASLTFLYTLGFFSTISAALAPSLSSSSSSSLLVNSD